MADRTPAQITRFFEEHGWRFDVPVQWLGDEPNSYRKPWDESDVRVCVFACWAYEQASGNQAIPLVYRTINEMEGMLADRCYFPSTPRDLRWLERYGIPIHGIESKHQLRDFDVIGTSVSYPVLTVNFVKQLQMSDIPVSWDDLEVDGKTVPGRHQRPEEWPFVIVGGQGYGAPEVLANIADAVFCGEIEDEPGQPGLDAVLQRIREFKDAGWWSSARMACYERLAVEFPFLYFPCFIDVEYEYEDRPSVRDVLFSGVEPRPSKQVSGYQSKVAGMRLPVVKRFVKDLDAIDGLTNPPLLYIDPGMGIGDFEVARGCPAWCSFCALTYRQKPYRQRSVDRSVEEARRLSANTGSLVSAPFGPDFPMHTQKKKLIKRLLEEVTDEVDASSMRVDDFTADPQYMMISAYGGMEQVTLGVEGNSQRMRDFVGKGCSDDDIKEAVARGIQAGIKRFKLYMIASLPGEDDGDIYRIVQLAKELADIRDALSADHVQILFSWTPMLIEGNTPLQWFSPTTANWSLGDVFEILRDLRITFKMGGKASRDKHLFFQASQRASREVGKAIVEVVAGMEKGTWGGAPQGLANAIEDRLLERGFLNGYADLFDERFRNDFFGWEMIDQGINVELMWQAYSESKQFLENTDSLTYDEQLGDEYHGNEWIERCDSRCYGQKCGVCDVEDLKHRRKYIQRALGEVDVDLSAVKVIDQTSVAMTLRAQVVKSSAKRHVMNDHWKHAVRRAAQRADVPITKRTVRFASDSVRHREWASGTDYVEFGLLRIVTPEEMETKIAAMNTELGEAIQITSWRLMPALTGDMRRDIDLSLYEIEVETSVAEALAAVRAWHEADEVMIKYREESGRGFGPQNVLELDAKKFVDDAWMVRDGHRLAVRVLVRGRLNPYNVYAAMFGHRSWVEASKHLATRVESFVETEAVTIDFFRPNCQECGRAIPVNVLDEPYDAERCPRCDDVVRGRMVEEVAV